MTAFSSSFIPPACLPRPDVAGPQSALRQRVGDLCLQLPHLSHPSRGATLSPRAVRRQSRGSSSSAERFRLGAGWLPAVGLALVLLSVLEEVLLSPAGEHQLHHRRPHLRRSAAAAAGTGVRRRAGRSRPPGGWGGSPANLGRGEGAVRALLRQGPACVPAQASSTRRRLRPRAAAQDDARNVALRLVSPAVRDPVGPGMHRSPEGLS